MTIKISEDKDFVAAMREALKANENHCPCQLQRTVDTLCMCKSFRELDEGVCECGLYTKYKN